MNGVYWTLFFALLGSASCLERRMSAEKNPGCPNECKNQSLLYIRAEGPNDTLHYIWDFSRKPSIFLALTDVQSNLSIDWSEYETNGTYSVQFTTSPRYTFALILNKIIEFDDVNDTGVLTSATQNISYDTARFSWEMNKNLSSDSAAKFINLEVTGGNYNAANLTGTITIQLDAFGAENHDIDLPRLQHNPNSTQCRVALNRLTSDSGFNQSRYAIEFYLVSSDGSNASAIIVNRKNLDDENSPGVFAMTEIMTPQSQQQMFQGAYLQWRPIVYTSKVPNIANSTELFVYNLTGVAEPQTSLQDTLPAVYYGGNLSLVLVQQFIVSFGSKEDGFYKSTNYSTWTFLVSYGSPEEEKFSLLVILVMAIGLGLPALLILLGGMYMCARRCTRAKDELSLER